MKRIFTLALVALFVAGQTATAQTIWDGTTDTEWLGSGTQADPYQISTAAELAGFAELVTDSNTFEGQYLKITADIHLNDAATPDSLKREWPMIGFYDAEANYTKTAFSGHLDGGNHTIHGVYRGKMPVDTTNVDNWDQDLEIDFTGWYNGFFGYLLNSTVENLRFDNMTMLGGANVGGLCNRNEGGTIRNVHITNSWIGSSTGENGGNGGGLVADNIGGLIENCSVDATVQGLMYVGGLVGTNNSNGVIRDCSTSGRVFTKRGYVGGFAGENYGGLIERCSSSATVSRAYHKDAPSSIITCAGFAGVNCGVISDSYATGDVRDAQLSGAGFCGRNYSRVNVYTSKDYTALGRIENCYSTGDVHVSGKGTIAAFMGDNGIKGTYNGTTDHAPGTVINCFATGKTEFTDEGLQYQNGFTSGMLSQDIAIIIANGYFDKDKNPKVDIKKGGAFGVTAEYMQSKEFVDTLNMMSALFGLTKWQYNPGGYPTLTTEKATNLTDYLGGGSGTKDDPWLISTKEHLYNLAKYTNHGYNFAGKYILQTADIVMNAPQELWGEEAPELWEPIGHACSYPVWNGGSDPATWYNTGSYYYIFCGHYDGGLHEVQNIYAKDNKYGVGFFGSLVNAQIRNLGVTGAYMRGDEEMGILGVRMHTEVATNLWGDVPPMQIRQCWTSGSVDLVKLSGGVTSLVGKMTAQGYTGMGTGVDTVIVNCHSSATLGGAQYYTKLFTDSYNVDDIKERANLLYYGKVTANDHIRFFLNDHNNENYFVNFDSITGTHNNSPLGDKYSSTVEMQSKELLNRMNYFVSKYNHLHPTDPLLFWKHNAGAYPSFTATEPEHTVTFVSNGGTELLPEKVYDNSKMYLPPYPTKEGAIFAGWYANSELTQVFDTAGVVLSDTTLYAKWLTSIVPDYKPFTNEFATAYVIKTKEQLYAFANIVNGTANIASFIEPTTLEGKTVKLGADIVLNDTADWEYWGNGVCAVNWEPIGQYAKGTSFNGTFDGQSYTISGLYHWGEGSSGLFGQVGEKAIIQNVTIKASFVRGTQGTLGLLIGSNKGVVSNCTVEGVVCVWNGGYLGLLIGDNNSGKGNITNCHAKGRIYGNSSGAVGGLIGSMQISEYSKDTIRNCSAEVDFALTNYNPNSDNTAYVGGLAGFLAGEVPVIGCYATGDIYMPAGGNVGGLVGKTDALIDSCYATGNVSAVGISVPGNNVGGLVGFSKHDVTNSYATGHVVGNNTVGGVAGVVRSVINSHAAGNVTAYSNNAGGLAGVVDGYGGMVTDCYATGVVTSGYTAGGVIASTNEYLSVVRCWSAGDVTGSSYVGGIVGYGGGTIEQSYSLSNITGTGEYVFGIGGTQVINCYALGNVSGLERVSGCLQNNVVTNSYFAGEVTQGQEATMYGPLVAIPSSSVINSSYFNSDKVSSTETYGKTTEQMKQQSTFAGWDFDEIWGIHPNHNNGYPYLRYSLKDSEVSVLMLSANNVVLKLDETKQLTAYLPKTVQGDIVWESGNAEIAMCVDGLITPVAYGKTYVVAHTADNTLSDTCWVQVVCDPIGVIISEQEINVLYNSTYQLSATVLPAEAEQQVKWTHSNRYEYPYITIDANGLIQTGGEVGDFNVYATTLDGRYRDTCVVHIVDALPVQSITLSHHELTLEKGQTATISATVLPEGATLSSSDWWSTDEWYVASVSADGNTATITARGGGTALIIASKDGVSDTCKVTVTDKSKVSGVMLDTHEVTLEVGQTYQLNATIFPETATNKDMWWRFENRDIAHISDGLITAHGVGTTKVWCETLDGSFTDTCYVTVVGPSTTLELSFTDVSMKIGEEKQINATITAGNSDQAITWTSTNETIATINARNWYGVEATITALAIGNVTITATTEDGVSASCQVTVQEDDIAVESITLSETTLQMEIGETHTLIATIFPSNATNQNYSWSSNNQAVATVGWDGTVTAHAAGSAIITATSEDGGKTATCQVTVAEPWVEIDHIELSDWTTIELTEGETYQLSVTVVPANASNITITWESGDNSIATVDNTGKVTAHKAGETGIRVRVSNGIFEHSKGCGVIVSEKVTNIPVTGISLSETSLEMTLGDTHALTATITPADATNQNINWLSTNPSIVSVQDGLLTAIAEGSATIIATTEDGGKTAMCNITVSKPAPEVIPVASIVLSQQQCVLNVGETYQLTALISPENATNKNVTWAVYNNPEVVSVQDGLVTALAEGNGVVGAKTEDGGFEAGCFVIVNPGTALEDVEANTTNCVRKVMEKGVIYIIRNDKRYLPDGRSVK